MLKAYRELEREGLVRARPGMGTFVMGKLPRTDTTTQARISASLNEWMLSARAAGLDFDDIEAIYHTAVRNCISEGADQPTRSTPAGSRATLGAGGAARLHHLHPGGLVVGLVGLNGRRQNHLLHMAVGLLEPTAGIIKVLGAKPAETAYQLQRVAFVAQETPLYAAGRDDGEGRKGDQPVLDDSWPERLELRP